jgi:hypothetical protein
MHLLLPSNRFFFSALVVANAKAVTAAAEKNKQNDNPGTAVIATAAEKVT